MPRLAPLTLDGGEQGRFLSTYICPRPSSDLDVEFETRPGDIGAEETRNSCLVDCVGEMTFGHGVFAPYVGETLGRSCGESGDGHRFDDGEWIAFHQDPILEGARLRLVTVGDDVLDITTWLRRLRAI